MVLSLDPENLFFQHATLYQFGHITTALNIEKLYWVLIGTSLRSDEEMEFEIQGIAQPPEWTSISVLEIFVIRIPR